MSTRCSTTAGRSRSVPNASVACRSGVDRPVAAEVREGRLRGSVGRTRRRSSPSGRLPRAGRGRSESYSLSGARRELRLTPREFELCLDAGELRVIPRGLAGRHRVAAHEVRRLGACKDHPEGLRHRLRLVRTREGAALLGVPPSRFAQLARAGALSPVRYTVSRYHQLSWHYLAVELEQLRDRQSTLLGGPLPGEVRIQAREGQDWRPRLWRRRRMEQILRHLEDPWAVAAVYACVLDQQTLEEIVPDTWERLALAELRPVLAPRPVSVQARRRCGDLLTADPGEEARQHRYGLTLALVVARTARPAEEVWAQLASGRRKRRERG